MKRKRLFYQATHRSTKEADLIIGGLVRTFFDDFCDDEWNCLDSLLKLDDHILLPFFVTSSCLPDVLPLALQSKIMNYRELAINLKKPAIFVKVSTRGMPLRVLKA